MGASSLRLGRSISMDPAEAIKITMMILWNVLVVVALLRQSWKELRSDDQAVEPAKYQGSANETYACN